MQNVIQTETETEILTRAIARATENTPAPLRCPLDEDYSEPPSRENLANSRTVRVSVDTRDLGLHGELEPVVIQITNTSPANGWWVRLTEKQAREVHAGLSTYLGMNPELPPREEPYWLREVEERKAKQEMLKRAEVAEEFQALEEGLRRVCVIANEVIGGEDLLYGETTRDLVRRAQRRVSELVQRIQDGPRDEPSRVLLLVRDRMEGEPR